MTPLAKPDLQRETIVAAAVRIRVAPKWRKEMWNGGRVYPDHLIVSSPPPARHATLLHPLWPRFAPGPDDQGFLTSTGRYVGREEALQIALAAGQPIIREDKPEGQMILFSEDLW